MEAQEKIHKNKKEIFTNNFIGGVAWGLGVTVGLSVLLALIGFLISNIEWVPIFGSIISEAAQQVLQNNPQLVQ